MNAAATIVSLSLTTQFTGAQGIARLFFTGILAAEDTQREYFTRLTQAAGDAAERLSVQFIFKALAEMAADDLNSTEGADVYDWSVCLPIAKRFVTAFVTDGWMRYTAAAKYSDGTQSQAYYTIDRELSIKSITALCRDAGKGRAVGQYLQVPSEHTDGANAMASYVFQLNSARGKEAHAMLRDGMYLTKAEQWKLAETQKEKKRHEQQVRQFRAACEVKRAFPAGFSFDVKADFRGRLYYVAGMLNPQAGGVAGYLLTNSEQVTYDSTASFAQFIAVLTNDEKLGAACGLLNYSDTPSDFYAATLALATNAPQVPKSSPEREIAKAYLMPKAYGAGDEASKTRAAEIAEEKGIDPKLAGEIVDVLSKYEGLDVVKNASSTRARYLAREHNQQLEWVSPSGFTVVQNYWERRNHIWKVNGDTACCPTAITFSIKTETVRASFEDLADDATADEIDAYTARAEANAKVKACDVAAAANFVQSLDAAFMAKCLAAYKRATGKTFIAIHDSCTFNSRDEIAVFLPIAWEVFRAMANSDEIKAMRKEIGLAPANVHWLRETVPMFMAEE